ncbi:mediator complex subunit [Blastocladiella emersonii ATCC 22665]|nr:mediator complex subunit [Blastocladiella emersonii ATCC 22665]
MAANPLSVRTSARSPPPPPAPARHATGPPRAAAAATAAAPPPPPPASLAPQGIPSPAMDASVRPAPIMHHHPHHQHPHHHHHPMHAKHGGLPVDALPRHHRHPAAAYPDADGPDAAASPRHHPLPDPAAPPGDADPPEAAAAADPRRTPVRGLDHYDPHRRLDPHYGVMVPLAAVVRRVTYTVMKQLNELVLAQSRHMDSDPQKRELLSYVRQARAVLAKLAIVMQWARHSSAYVCAQSIVAMLQTDDAAFDAVSAQLFQFTERMAAARRHNADVPTAISVLTAGTYRGLPRSIAAIRGPEPLADDDAANLLATLDAVIRTRLLTQECAVPDPFRRNYHIANGQVTFVVPDEFAVTLILPGGPDPAGHWHLLDFRILDPTLSLLHHQTMHLMSLGNSKLQAAAASLAQHAAAIASAAAGPASGGSSAAPAVDLASALRFPLLELYSFYHHFVLLLRLEKMTLEAEVLRSATATSGVDSAVLHQAESRLDVRYWSKSCNPGRVQIVLREEPRRELVNVSHHPLLAPPPDPAPVPARVSLPVEPVMVEATSVASELVLIYCDREEPVPAGLPLDKILAACMDVHIGLIHRALAALVGSPDLSLPPSGPALLRKRPAAAVKALLPAPPSSTSAVAPAVPPPPPIPAPGSPPAAPIAASVVSSDERPPYVSGGSLYLPHYALALSVHRNSGLFHVVPLDRFHDKLDNVRSILNKDPVQLAEGLACLATVQLLDQVEASLTFLGFERADVAPLMLGKAAAGQQQGGSSRSGGGPPPQPLVDLASGANFKALGDDRFLRVLQLPHDPAYRLAINVVATKLTCWVLDWPGRVVIKEYQPTLDDIVETFRQYTFLHRIQPPLRAHRIRTEWHGLCLAVDLTSFPPGSAVLSTVESVTIEPTGVERFPLQVAIRTRVLLPGLSATALEIPCSSATAAVEHTVAAFAAIRLLAQADPEDVVSADLAAARVVFELAGGASMTVTGVAPAVPDPTDEAAAAARKPAEPKPAASRPATGSKRRASTASLAVPPAAKRPAWPVPRFAVSVDHADGSACPAVASLAHAYLESAPASDLRLALVLSAADVWATVAHHVRSWAASPAPSALPGPAGAGYPRLVAKSLTHASVWLAASAAVHLRYLPAEDAVAVTATAWHVVSALARAVREARVDGSVKVVELHPATLLVSAAAVDVLMAALDAQLREQRDLIDAHAMLVRRFPAATQPPPTSSASAAPPMRPGALQEPRGARVEAGAVHLQWAGLAIRIDRARGVVATIVAPNAADPPTSPRHGPGPGAAHHYGEWSAAERSTFANLLTAAGASAVAESHAVAGSGDADDYGAVLVPRLTYAVIKVMELPWRVLRALAQCPHALFQHAVVQFLLLAPRPARVPASVANALPPFPRSAVVVSGATAPGAAAAASLMFTVAFPNAGDGGSTYLVPLVYAWDANVVSPWEASSGIGVDGRAHDDVDGVDPGTAAGIAGTGAGGIGAPGSAASSLDAGMLDPSTLLAQLADGSSGAGGGGGSGGASGNVGGPKPTPADAAALAAAGGSNGQLAGPTVPQILNELKTEAFARPPGENRLAWTLVQVVHRFQRDPAAAATARVPGSGSGS